MKAGVLEMRSWSFWDVGTRSSCTAVGKGLLPSSGVRFQEGKYLHVTKSFRWNVSTAEHATSRPAQKLPDVVLIALPAGGRWQGGPRGQWSLRKKEPGSLNSPHEGKLPATQERLPHIITWARKTIFCGWAIIHLGHNCYSRYKNTLTNTGKSFV